MSDLEKQFLTQIRAEGLALPIAQFQFAPQRKWKFDFAWPTVRLAVEVEGGVYTQGRHTRATGFINDCDKYNSAAFLGWRVLRFTTKHISEGKAVKMLSAFLKSSNIITNNNGSEAIQ